MLLLSPDLCNVVKGVDLCIPKAWGSVYLFGSNDVSFQNRAQALSKQHQHQQMWWFNANENITHCPFFYTVAQAGVLKATSYNTGLDGSAQHCASQKNMRIICYHCDNVVLAML